ncbi:cytochrome b [Aestuariivirga litoralis]|uniref:cytochrome b n=1 Tax=Aestuariivirga litoralis TaxID=2650924 RepID=UPI0018C76E06|nr:cytochrome b/b6 domain-containing protein [Aestuariivirga litoralis]MBG1231779.1 cytochrome b [Aestuariivirga litoralis]
MAATGNVSSVKYSAVAVILHWVTAVVVIYMLFWGEDLIRGRTPANPALHASLGFSILVLTIARLAWRFAKPPPPDVPMPRWQALAGHVLHWIFYGLLILIPLSGMAALDQEIAGRHPEFASLTFFGLFTVPHFSLGPLGAAHGLMTNLMIGLLALHVLAALKHQFIDRDGLINRMLPR